MNLGGLSPDKAPPVEAPLSLFYLMPLFLGLAGLVLLLHGDQAFSSRWSGAALSTTHLITLGVLAPVMCGALLQVSPVLLGAPFARVRWVAGVTAAGLGFGSSLIAAGFLFALDGLLWSGGVAVTLALSVFLVAAFRAFAVAAVRHETLWSARLAVFALGITLALGLTLATARLGWVELPIHLDWVNVHVAWGLGGWVGLLLAGIGMEIVPLFYVTPSFPMWLKRSLPFLVFGLLVLLLLRGGARTDVPGLAQWLVVGLLFGHTVYNLLALRMQSRRQRPRRDATLWLWQLSHVSVLTAAGAWLAGVDAVMLGVLLIGAAVLFVAGSLLKILPFLIWLDLQQKRVAGAHMSVRLPRLHNLLPDAIANAIAVCLAGSLFSALLAAWLPALGHLSGLLLLSGALLFGRAMLRGFRLRQTVVQAFADAAASISRRPVGGGLR